MSHRENGRASRPRCGTVDRRQLLVSAAAVSAYAGLGVQTASAAAASTSVVRGVTGTFPARTLLKANLAQLLDYKNGLKAVEKRQVVDAMTDKAGWFSSDVVSLTPTTHSKSGKGALQFRTLLRNEEYIKASRNKNGSFSGQAILFAGQPFSAFAVKHLAPVQDWTAFNRLSIWCYVHPTTNPVNSISVQFICDGADAGPEDPVSVHYFADLQAGEWNHLVWEFPEIKRDKVSQIVIFQPIAGLSNAGSSPEIVYDFDEIVVETVEAERVEGWAVTPGKLAYSHLGYVTSGEKLAVSGGTANTFELINVSTQTSTQLGARTVQNRGIDYKVLDFSQVSKPGTYRLKHDEIHSEPFKIEDNAWRALAEATLNAFYGFRCGYAVAGAHDACHLDVFAEYNGERRSVSGGWHDAANLTQGPYRTHLSIYALINLHDALRRQGETALAEKALEEARWGLEWSLRGRFGPGMRALYVHVSYWTDSKTGDADDVVQEDQESQVGRDNYQNTLAALAAARAARALAGSNPKLAKRLIKNATEDYADVVAHFAVPTEATPREINEPSWRDQIGYLTLAAVELYRTTHDAKYQADAAKWAKLLQQTQELRFVDGIAVAGYFYEDAGRTRIVHEYHNSFEDCGLLAYAALCETFPDHPDWINWYAGLAIYADYFCDRGSQASAPFSIIPAAVWRQSDLDAPLPPDQTGMRLASMGPTPVFPTAPTPALIRAQMQRMFEAGTDLGKDYRLRFFPLWSDHIRHGATTVHMSKTIGLAAAAQVMGRADLSELSSRQLQWTIGANPLSRSLIYGVGNDFWQNFTSELPNLVGGMSLGFNSYRDDAPAWGNNAVFPYKEMWIYSSCRIAHNLVRVGVPSKVSGQAPTGAIFRNERTGQETKVRPGRYEILLPAGHYGITFGGENIALELAHASDCHLDLNPKTYINLTIEQTSVDDGCVRLKLTAKGAGKHSLSARVFNASLSGLPETITLQSGHEFSCELTLSSNEASTPWLLKIGSDGFMQTGTTISGFSPKIRSITNGNQ